MMIGGPFEKSTLLLKCRLFNDLPLSAFLKIFLFLWQFLSTNDPFGTFHKYALLWKRRMLHNSPISVLFRYFLNCIVFQEIFQLIISLYAIITTAGEAFAKSALLWKCHELYVLPFPVVFCNIFNIILFFKIYYNNYLHLRCYND